MAVFRNIPWPRVVAESAIIVASILLALWVDAWWNNRHARLDEAVLLNAVRSELEHFIQVSAAEQRQAQAIQESARKLLEFSRSPTADISDRQIDAWLSDLTWYANYQDMNLAVTESLVSGGRLGLISNRELRATIISWPLYMTGFTAASQIDLDFERQQFLPYLFKHASIAQIYAADDGQPGNVSQTFPLSVGPDEYVPRSHKDLLQEAEFQNLLMERISILYNFQGWHTDSNNISTLEDGLNLLVTELEALSK